jgi:hypothetical protein
MDSLLKKLCSVDYEDYGSLQLLESQEKDGNLYLVLDVTADEEPDVPKNIRVTCRSPRESNLAPGHYDDFSISEDHVLLWHYAKPHTSTSFYGKVHDPLSVVGALYERHVELVEDWIPFQKYINSELRLSELIRGSFGLLANGPEPLVLSYEEVMQSFGFSTSHHETPRPKYWNGKKSIEENAALSVMILDESYVIAEAFKAEAI